MIKLREYRIWLKKEDPSLTAQLPAPILKAITHRAIENGHSVEVEIATRLARTLEMDETQQNEES